jgi:hypothetical protein
VLAGHHVRELLPYAECADVMRDALAALACYAKALRAGAGTEADF